MFNRNCPSQKVDTKCLVIGGCGFLGRNLVEDLLSRGYDVSVFDMKKTYQNEHVTFFIGDLCNISDLKAAIEGCSLVFTCASPRPTLGNRNLFYQVNVKGTETLIQACRECKVRKLVLTSSAIVVYNGVDLKAGDENLPYANRPLDYYSETKIIQEKLVLRASTDDLLTCAIRPFGIIGPGDVQCIPGMVEVARAGRAKYIIGKGDNLVDFTYVKNATLGHILAAQNLYKGSPTCGQAYNITNDAPIPFWEFFGTVLEEFGYQKPKKHLPFKFVYFIVLLIQFIAYILKPIINFNPTLTPLRVSLACTHHYFSCEKAKRDFGYSPVISLEEGIRLSLLDAAYLKNKQ